MKGESRLRCLHGTQAITAMIRELRRGNGKTGLVLANGGVVTYQHVICLSSSPRPDGLPYPDRNPLPDYITDVQVPAVDVHADGDATIEVSRDLSMLIYDTELSADIYGRVQQGWNGTARACRGKAEVHRPPVHRKPCRSTYT